jgi:SAM-dependent methyltransferase
VRRLLGKASGGEPLGGSGAYWKRRYAEGGNSGAGSYGPLAAFKAQVLNDFIASNSVTSAIEFGCGDGNQLAKVRYPRYVGLDVSPLAIRRCASLFRDDPTKSFFLYGPECFIDNAGVFRADVALSLDVIFHLVEDDVYETHMTQLFDCAERFVVIYSSNRDERQRTHGAHVRHREFTSWVVKERPNWRPSGRVERPATVQVDPTEQAHDARAEFFFFTRRPE